MMKTQHFIPFLLVAGCAVGGGDEEFATTEHASFEEFRDSTYHEDFEGGVYIVNGDTPVVDDKALYEVWESMQQGALIVNKVGNSDDRWSDAQKKNLTYCVSNNFGARKQQVIDAMKRATEQVGWETMADVNFIYVPAEDANCTTSNTNIVFPVKMVSGQPYLARAFFPSSPKSARDVLIDTSSFASGGWPLANVIGHELGHVLGFRHEHTRPEAGACFEDNKWRPLTAYDSASIMHYPHCNGSSNSLSWSNTDRAGASSLYGAPGGGGGTTNPPPSGNVKTETKTGSLAQGTATQVGVYSVVGGTTLRVVMSGTGDPDLYVRFGSVPTSTQFSCRPYLDGPNEQCELTVPSNTSAYVVVHGYTAATYSVKVDWTAP